MATKGARIERFVSVDIEASGPIPGEFSMLALGACEVANLASTFYVELKPINRNFVPAALEVSSLDLDVLAVEGREAAEAMSMFQAWLQEITAPNEVPVFVGFNAGFDWSFVNWYFIRFLGENPFGFAPLDVKAYYMGLVGCGWEETKSSRIRPEFQPASPGNHSALVDARAQAEMFRKLLAAERPREG